MEFAPMMLLWVGAVGIDARLVLEVHGLPCGYVFKASFLVHTHKGRS